MVTWPAVGKWSGEKGSNSGSLLNVEQDILKIGYGVQEKQESWGNYKVFS